MMFAIDTTRRRTLVGWSVPLMLLAGVLAAAERGSTPRAQHAAGSFELDDELSLGDGADYLLREGAQLRDQLGEFREAGQRIRFYLDDGKTSFTVLENLALERVSRVLDEHPTPRVWSVSGTVTEYRGANYLVVTRAVLKAKNRVVAERPLAEK